MLNDKHHTWTTSPSALPEPGRPLWILVEHDAVQDEDVQAPFVRKAVARHDPGGVPEWTWRLLDHDPETEEAELQQCFTVAAWRYA